ncbi:hypothetical protein LOK49_LG05G03253 [Camellia lanceoleosa]|uniref:Uncharacterized protein n=1 Tax=Camellia lanceoleosa TaxID=1840588 RepID=A0ACC0HQW2_9ERIC|nr:hypothetical protein LOK49_LG05G03253 [Camellia lanceoleosa]
MIHSVLDWNGILKILDQKCMAMLSTVTGCQDMIIEMTTCAVTEGDDNHGKCIGMCPKSYRKTRQKLLLHMVKIVAWYLKFIILAESNSIPRWEIFQLREQVNCEARCCLRSTELQSASLLE